MNHRKPVIRLDGIHKSFPRKEDHSQVLKNISLTVYVGESCAILGASGSGKSTLLNIMGLLDMPDSGHYRFVDQSVYDLNHDQLAAIRNQKIGFVFQSFNLLSQLTAVENVALPLTYRGLPRSESLARARQLLVQVGLEQRVDYRPADLSGGQRQRVAIARALVGNPSVILADEPTGNLDSDTAAEIMDLLLLLNREHRVTLVVVTHDHDIARRMSRQIRVHEGAVLESEGLCPSH